MSNYNYAIEKHLAEHGGEADKGITRTCGNCELYNERLLTCEHVENEYNTSIYKANEAGMLQPPTHPRRFGAIGAGD